MSVRIAHISKHIAGRQVLSDISLSIQKGEVVGLLGPNGAGKSTLMKIMVGVWDADTTSKESVLCVPQKIGFLPEQNPLYEEMYVREYLNFFLRLEYRCVPNDILEDLLERVGLTSQAFKQVRELSKGYRQRLGLAAALIGEPELLILDEPTTGLDPNQLEEIRALIRSLGESRTIILSTHVLQEVMQMCSRVLIIDHGVIRADMPIREIGSAEELERIFHELTSHT